MFVFITLTSAGADAGPFNLYSNADGYVSAFATNVPKATLLAGYAATVPAGTTTVRIMSAGVCTNYIDVAISATTTTTTTTGTPTTTTTTTTMAATTTTTTTTMAVINCGTTSVFTSGGASYPTTELITLTTSTGTIVLNYNAVNVPDRFIVDWNGSVVIDTGYRGYAALYDYGESARSTFTSSLTGLIDPITLTPYPNFSTYPDDGYPRIVGPGAGTVSFVKNLASNTFATIKVYAPMDDTAWSYTMNCPTTTTTTTTAPL